MAWRIRGNRLVIDFRCDLPDGRRVRCVESEGENTERNCERVIAKWKAVEYALKYDRFDYLKFFPRGSKARCFEGGQEETLFSSWWERWLEGQAVRPNTMRRWMSVYKAHLGEHFGDLYLKDITEQEVRVFRRKLLEVKGLREQTVNIAVKTLCQSLRRAIKEGLITSDPCEDIRPLKSRKTEISPFTFQELSHLIETARFKAPELTDMLILWSRTGLRTGEIFGLKWEDVDYFSGLLHIRRTMHVAGREGDPKTEGSERSLPLRKPSIEALRRQEARTALRRSYVFLNQKGEAIRATTWREKWIYLLRLAGLSYRSPKQMRHTFATLHLAAGESVSWVSRMLGHSSAKVTFDFYNCYVPNLTRDDGSAFDRLMDGQNGNNLVTMADNSLK